MGLTRCRQTGSCSGVTVSFAATHGFTSGSAASGQPRGDLAQAQSRSLRRPGFPRCRASLSLSRPTFVADEVRYPMASILRLPLLAKAGR